MSAASPSVASHVHTAISRSVAPSATGHVTVALQSAGLDLVHVMPGGIGTPPEGVSPTFSSSTSSDADDGEQQGDERETGSGSHGAVRPSGGGSHAWTRRTCVRFLPARRHLVPRGLH